MRACVLIARLASGKLTVVPDVLAAPVMEQAKQARQSGLLDGERVIEGVVLSTANSFPLYSFRAEAPAEPERKGKGKPKD